MPVNWTEKRRSPRIYTKVPLRYQIRGKPESSSVVSGDISVGGLGFLNDSFIAPNNYLNVEINLLPQVVNATVKVVRSDALPRSDRFRLGTEFIEMDYRQKQILSDYITQHESS